MFPLKKAVHDSAMSLGRYITKLLPDRIPVTFVGTGASAELCESIAQTQVRKVLVVTDAMLVKIGLVDSITGALTAAGIPWSIYDGVEPDPTFDQVEAGFAQLGRDDCDAILAVGGGSPMDAAKVIAAMARNGGDAHKLIGNMKVRRAPLPLFAIPTTSGTGSEVTYAAVISDGETHVKKLFVDPKLMPGMTALDPELTRDLPAPITAATGMDALTHAVESFLCLTSTSQTEGYATTATRMVFEHLPEACSNGSQLSARKGMALASYYAGLAFTRTGVGYVHAIAHTFGAYYRTPHGLANAIALPNVLEFSRESARERLARLADVIGLDGGSDDERAGKFIDAVRDLMTQIEIPATLADLESGDIPGIAAQALAEAHLMYPVPRYMSQEECEGLLARMVA